MLLKLYFTNIILSQLLKKPQKRGEAATEKMKERGEEIDAGDGQREACSCCAVLKAKPWESTQDGRREKRALHFCFFDHIKHHCTVIKS